MIVVSQDGEEIAHIDGEEIQTEDVSLDYLFYDLVDEGVPVTQAPGTVKYEEATPERIISYLKKQGYEARESKEATDDMPSEIADTIMFAGLNIAIENPVGSIRSGPGWSVKMKNAYGYIIGSQGVDGDAVDVFLGPAEGSQRVFVIHTAGEDPEDKVMLGFTSEREAHAAFVANYSSDKFFDSMDVLSLERFTRKIFSTHLGEEIA